MGKKNQISTQTALTQQSATFQIGSTNKKIHKDDQNYHIRDDPNAKTF
jgi:hypothetical protein